MNIMLQTFYWDCTIKEQKQGKWWNYLTENMAGFKKNGIQTIYLPPPFKSAHGIHSMGYDPYDFFDLGEFNQKGSISTAWGTKNELIKLIQTAHRHSIQVVIDLVINHCSGGEKEKPPLTNKRQWSLFEPMSSKFYRNWESFYPCKFATDKKYQHFAPYLNLCFENPDVKHNVLQLCKWLVEEIEIDGFRFDYAKGYVPELIREIMNLNYQRKGEKVQITGIAEYWDENPETLSGWMQHATPKNKATLSTLDFITQHIFNMIHENKRFSWKRYYPKLASARFTEVENITGFLDNHDTERDSTPKSPEFCLMAYSYLLIHYNKVCIFWKHYQALQTNALLYHQFLKLVTITKSYGNKLLDSQLINNVIVTRVFSEKKLAGIYFLNAYHQPRKTSICFGPEPFLFTYYSGWTANNNAFQKTIHNMAGEVQKLTIPPGYLYYTP